ncbi:Internalin-J precursor [Finegoldia magna]|uniref:Internalin-J n=2 Tax=Finegoldia magna TaxID=1260 RepID=A0A6N2Y770_FINMA
MKEKNKHFGKILFSVLLAVAFIVFAGIKPIYANILSPKQGINEYHFYNDTIENKDSAKEIQKQVITDKGTISDPGHVFKDKDKVLLKWQDEKGNDIKFDTPIEITGNDKKIINVYPVFKNQVVITYYISGSKNDRVYMTDTITDASSYKLPVDPTIYDANKYFVNWSTSKDGSSGVYDENSLKKDIEAGKTDIKLYAITEFKHKATFITGDGASFQEQILANDGGNLDKTPENPTREGYEFSHWSLTEDGNPVDLATLKLNEDIDVYAVWKPVVVDYKFKVMVQNINDDGYTFHEIISARGLNGEKTSLPFKGSENPDPKVAPSGPIVEDINNLTEKDGRFSDGYNSKDENGKMDHTYTNPQTLDYLGFHLNEEKTKQAFETIEADGSTVVPVYMDRNVHTIWVYKNKSAISYYPANWVNATDENGNIHVDLRYGQSSETWFDKLNKDYIYYMDKSIGSFYTRAPAMGDKDIYMYRVFAKGTKYQLRFVEWDPSKFNAQINGSDLATMKSTLGTMKEIGERVSFQNSEWYMNWNGYQYRVFEPYNGNYKQDTYSWVDKTDHVDDIEGFQPKKGDMTGLQSSNVNNPAFRDYMFTPRGWNGYYNYTGTPYIEDGSYVGFLFYERKTYNINYYSGSTRLASKPYKYEADTSDFGLGYEKGVTTHPKNPNKVFMGWYEDSTFSVEHKHEDGSKMPAHDITVYAKWDSRQYEVTFHTNQDDYENNIEKISEIPEDDTLYDGKYKDEKVSKENFPQPIEPKGATKFLGWYEKNQYGRYVKANLHKPIKNDDTHLYAKWKYDYLELKYDLNLPATDKVEGTAPTDSNSYIRDAKALATDVGDVKVNGGKKVFVGWSETKDGSSGLILPSETILMDKNKTLYAQWKEFPDLKTTKVTYDANGGVGDQYVVEEIITNDSHTVLGNGEGEKIKFTREGYVFKGWNTDKDATKAKFQKGNEVTVDSENEDTNNYIYAIWAPIINYTTDGNGQVKEGQNFVDNTKEEVELKTNPKGTGTEAKEGYKFSHWTADKNIKLSDGTEIKAGEKITEEQLKQAVITEPLTFKANFVKDEFKVTHEFKVAEDSPVKEMPADVKSAVDSQLPENKTAEDGKTTTPGELKDPKDVEDKTNDGVWKFEGFKDQDKTTDEVDAKVNGADVTFEGAWKFTPNEHKVTYKFESEDPTKPLPDEVKNLLPNPEKGKVKGDKVTPTKPVPESITTKDGVWTFVKYDKESETVDNKDLVFTGTWKFSPKPDPVTYNVNHQFKSATEGKDLPQSVKDQLPDQQTGKEDGSVVKPTAPTQTEVKDTENDGTWTFEGYKDLDTTTDDVDAKVDGADVMFEGTWKFKPNEHKVTYEYVSGTEGKELPEALKNKAPKEVTGKVKGDKVTSPIPTGDDAEYRDDANKGTWKFKSYDKDSVEITNKDENVKGTWEFTPDPEPGKYNVTHKFVSKDPNKELPQAVKDLTPAQQTGKKDGSTVTPTAPEQTTVKDTENDGTWTFEGFKDQNPDTKDVDAKVNGADVTFEGEWKFTPNEHNVTYEYVSGTEGKELPEALKAKAPAKVTGKVKGDTVTSPVPTGKDAEYRDEANKGTWTFKSYDKNDVTISNQDEKVTGTWEFTPDPEPGKFNVTHEFVSATEGKDLPKAVTDLTPAQQTGKKDGETVTPTDPKQKTVEDTENDGTWTFEGYDENSKTIDKSDVTFEGKWKFTPNEHKVTYKFESEDPTKPLPDEVKNLLPDPEKDKVKGDKVTPTKPIPEEITTQHGVWTFVGYDEESKTVGDKDVEFIGKWKFSPKPDPVTYNVNHQFKSATEGKDLPQAVKDQLPAQQIGKEDGSVVTPTAPTQTELKDAENDGTWTFEGYKDQDTTTDEVDAKVDGADVTFEGAWKFTPNKHNVTYEYVSGTEGKKLPEALKAKAPAKVTGKVKGETVTSPVPTGDDATFRDEANKGTWKFKSYDKNEVEISNKDEKVTGTWVFTPDAEVVTEYVDEDGKTIAPKENGTKDKKDIDGYEFVRTEKDDKGNTKHIYKKKVTPTPDVVTEYVDEDGKTISDKEDGKQPKKDIDGYEFVRTEKDDKGNTKHIYKKKTTPSPAVETRYVDTEGKQILADKAGTHDPSTIEGYQFVRTDKDENGNTIHVYKKIAPAPKVETRYVDENGNQLLPPKEGTQGSVAIDGYNYIRTSKDNDGNTIHIYSKTPFEDVETRYVDTDGNQILADKAGTHDPSTIEGYQFVRTDKDENGNTIHVYKKIAPAPKVETRYVDENGNQLLPPKEGTQGSVAIDGYNYIRTSKDNDGNTIHIYSKTPFEDVETRYVDTDGNQILADKAGTHDPSTIEGYQFVRTDKDENGNTIHVYKKIAPAPKVETRYVDENGNQLLLPKEGTQAQKTIEGYEFVKTKKDKDGNTVHIYKKKTTTPTVDKITKFVDEKGNEISKSTKGDNPKKDIDGYEFVKTEKDKDGNTVHIYRRKTPTPTVDKITKFVDEEGNEISKSTKGDNPKKDIDGYEFVKTEKDKDGNTVHIYRRKTPTPTVDKITKFVDENGKEISKSTKGDNPKMDIDGYEFVKTTTDKDGNTVHIYRRKTSTPSVGKITKFVDENGKEISKSTKGDNPKKDIDGYEFVKTEKDKDGNTVHIYRRKTPTPTVDKITKFVDENGKEISKSTKGDNPKMDIDGYEFVKTTTDKDGNTVHIYRRKTSTPSVGKITKFVDENGKEISKSTKGDNPKKDIDGYEFVKTEKDKDGNTVHIYRRKTPTPTVDKITKFVDENGKEISKSTKGDNPKKDIDGYEFVKTTTDKDGNTVHIYKKKTNTRVITQGNNTINSSSPNKKGTLVNTGDGVNASTYAIIMLAIGGVLTGIGIRKKKKEA